MSTNSDCTLLTTDIITLVLHYHLILYRIKMSFLLEGVTITVLNNLKLSCKISQQHYQMPIVIELCKIANYCCFVVVIIITTI